jgi:hypothetical protein
MRSRNRRTSQEAGLTTRSHQLLGRITPRITRVRLRTSRACVCWGFRASSLETHEPSHLLDGAFVQPTRHLDQRALRSEGRADAVYVESTRP